MKRKRGGSSYRHRHDKSICRTAKQSGAYRKEGRRLAKGERNPYTEPNRNIEYERHQCSLDARSAQGSFLILVDSTHVLDNTMQWASQTNSYGASASYGPSNYS